MTPYWGPTSTGNGMTRPVQSLVHSCREEEGYQERHHSRCHGHNRTVCPDVVGQFKDTPKGKIVFPASMGKPRSPPAWGVVSGALHPSPPRQGSPGGSDPDLHRWYPRCGRVLAAAPIHVGRPGSHIKSGGARVTVGSGLKIHIIRMSAGLPRHCPMMRNAGNLDKRRPVGRPGNGLD